MSSDPLFEFDIVQVDSPGGSTSDSPAHGPSAAMEPVVDAALRSDSMSERGVEAFRADRDEVLKVAKSLSAEEWAMPSDCDGWRVQDVIAHMANVCRSVVDPGSLAPGVPGDLEATQAAQAEAHRDWTAEAGAGRLRGREREGSRERRRATSAGHGRDDDPDRERGPLPVAHGRQRVRVRSLLPPSLRRAATERADRSSRSRRPTKCDSGQQWNGCSLGCRRCPRDAIARHRHAARGARVDGSGRRHVDHRAGGATTVSWRSRTGWKAMSRRRSRRRRTTSSSGPRIAVRGPNWPSS